MRVFKLTGFLSYSCFSSFCPVFVFWFNSRHCSPSFVFFLPASRVFFSPFTHRPYNTSTAFIQSSVFHSFMLMEKFEGFCFFTPLTCFQINSLHRCREVPSSLVQRLRGTLSRLAVICTTTHLGNRRVSACQEIEAARLQIAYSNHPY